jgi:hypothetical protein
MTAYDESRNLSILTGDKGTLPNADALHWTLTVLFSTRGLLHDVCPLVTAGPMGCKTTDVFVDVSGTGALGSELYHI